MRAIISGLMQHLIRCESQSPSNQCTTWLGAQPMHHFTFYCAEILYVAVFLTSTRLHTHRQLAAIVPVVVLTFLLTRWSKEKSVAPPTPKLPRRAPGRSEADPLVELPPMHAMPLATNGLNGAGDSRKLSIAI